MAVLAEDQACDAWKTKTASANLLQSCGKKTLKIHLTDVVSSYKLTYKKNYAEKNNLRLRVWCTSTVASKNLNLPTMDIHCLNWV